MDLSLIIINWNSVDYIRECLKSIYRNLRNVKFEIIIIDNASFDGCANMIEEEFKEVIFIQNNENVGFAKANNLGFGASSGKVLLFLNPDTELLDNGIHSMYSSLIKMHDAGIVGCKLLNTDYTIQLNCILPMPTIVNEIFDIEFLKRKLYNIKIFGTQPLFSNDDRPHLVDVINGACIMIKREVFQKIELFSTDYFMYSEDVDLAYKVRDLGYNSYLLSKISIIHHGGKCAVKKKNSFFNAILIRGSRKPFFKKTKGKAYAQVYQIIIMAVSLIRMILILLMLPLSIINNKHQNLFASFLKWKNILYWSIGFEKWTNNAGNV